MSKTPETQPPPGGAIWSFDLGKASIGEAVRDRDSANFSHKASLIIPQDLARRGPATMSGTPASRHRMLQTRKAHDRREAWLEKIWHEAGMTPLQRRTVELVGHKLKKVKKRSNGKTRWTHKKVGGKWELKTVGDPKLEQEFGTVDGDIAGPSCVLRIRLLQDETLKPWQIYKALFSAIQKRGYGDVPWKQQRKGGDDKPKSAQEEAADAIADQRWKDFVGAVMAAGLDETYLRACYFDAWHMKLWSPTAPRVTHLLPTERPESTRKVVFPAHVIIEEVLALAAKAADSLSALRTVFDKVMADWSSGVEERIARVNAHGPAVMALPLA